jgi:hypothetical protein
MTINFLLHYTTLLILLNRPQTPQQGDSEESLKDASPINQKSHIQNTLRSRKNTHPSHGFTLAISLAWRQTGNPDWVRQ